MSKKHEKMLANLEARIKDYEKTVLQNKGGSGGFTKPGSRKHK